VREKANEKAKEEAKEKAKENAKEKERENETHKATGKSKAQFLLRERFISNGQICLLLLHVQTRFRVVAKWHLQF